MEQITQFFRENQQLVTFVAIIIIACWLLKNRSASEGYRNYVVYGNDMLNDGHYVIRGSRNNLYCSDKPNGFLCNADFAGPHETFLIQSLGNNQYAIQSMKTNLWASLTTTGITCISPTIGDNEVFNIKHMGGGKYSIQANKSKKYCYDDGSGLVCQRDCESDKALMYFNFIRVPYSNIK